jgi:beta-phosphoglucomutase-like phosphatase (HAD superfamily)
MHANQLAQSSRGSITCAAILFLLCAGVPVAVCSTSNERAVSTIVRVMLGEQVAAIMRVFAGDVVPKKKPDPAIYLLAAKELGVNPAR